MSVFVEQRDLELQIESVLFNLEPDHDWCLSVDELPARIYKPEFDKKNPEIYENVSQAVLGTFFVVEWLDFLKCNARRLELDLFENWLSDLRSLTTTLSTN